MTDLTTARAALAAHAASMDGLRLADAFAADPGRADRFSLSAGPLFMDLSRVLWDDTARGLLLGLAAAAGLEARRDAMFGGQAINSTEGRQVGHVWLREPLATARPEVADTRRRMAEFVRDVRAGGRFSHVVNIGIGGSDLGPAMVVQALEHWHDPALQFHFVSNIDPTHLTLALKACDPARTLFLVASKTFTTEETLCNARAARDWLVAARGQGAVAGQFVALSTAADKVAEFGIAPDRIFGFADWVGGRYSLWGAIGLSIMLAVGAENFEALLAGAHGLDRHFATAPLAQNLPVQLGLAGLWHRDFLGLPALAVLPYDQYLARLPAFLQQLDMESNGKGVDLAGRPVSHPTGPILFGEPGTNGQHAFYQLLHQGPDVIPAEFIAAGQSLNPIGDQHRRLLANMIAQARALMVGREGATPHQRCPGNRPSTVILMDRLSPASLGWLLALYEHKVFVQGVLWGLNSFDQFGVELGKVLASEVMAGQAGDSATEALMRRTGLL